MSGEALSREVLSRDVRPPASRFLTRTECQALAQRAIRLAMGGGVTQVMLVSTWTGNVRWARNQIVSSGDVRDNAVQVGRIIRGAGGSTTTNQIDDEALTAALRRAEQQVMLTPERAEGIFENRSAEPHSEPHIWSDTTYNLDAHGRAEAARALMAPAAAAGVVSVGYVEVSAFGQASIDSLGHTLYYPATRAQCSVTVRDEAAHGSGWAGVDFSDWGRIDVARLAAVAVEKCLRSRNPVALEPGRYVAILESQAVADIMAPLVEGALDRGQAEGIPGWGPFTRHNRRSKIGLRVFDPRVTISADPTDPDLGFPPFAPWSFTEVYHPVTWVQNGVLKELSYDRDYGVRYLGRKTGLPNSRAFRLAGGDTSLAEMISGTPRGVLVTRFSGVQMTDSNAVLLTGETRDGTWLIEHGQVSRAVKNMRFFESPLVAFNNLEALGPTRRVFRPDAPAVAPPAKVRDFNFTSLIEAF